GGGSGVGGVTTPGRAQLAQPLRQLAGFLLVGEGVLAGRQVLEERLQGDGNARRRPGVVMVGLGGGHEGEREEDRQATDHGLPVSSKKSWGRAGALPHWNRIYEPARTAA